MQLPFKKHKNTHPFCWGGENSCRLGGQCEWCSLREHATFPAHISRHTLHKYFLKPGEKCTKGGWKEKWCKKNGERDRTKRNTSGLLSRHQMLQPPHFGDLPFRNVTSNLNPTLMDQTNPKLTSSQMYKIKKKNSKKIPFPPNNSIAFLF